MGSLLVVLGGAMAGCSVEELRDTVEGAPEVELGTSDEGSPMVVLGGGRAGASVGVVGATVSLVVDITVLGGSVEVGFGNSVELELGGSVEVGGAAVLVGDGGLQGKSRCCL